jgi:hypothetical protein
VVAQPKNHPLLINVKRIFAPVRQYINKDKKNMEENDRQRQIELAMARGESILLEGNEEVITDSPEKKVEEEKPKEPKEEIPSEEEKKEPVAEPVTPHSSLKYIPISKYTAEKNEWKAEKELLARQVAELEQKYQAAAEDGKKFSDLELKDYFQKYNIPEYQQAAVAEMLSLAAKQHKIPEEVTSQISSMQRKLAEYEDEKRFDADWKSFTSDLLKQYPNATYSQLEKAKEVMDDLSHTEDKYLDNIAFREKEIFDEIFQSPVKKGFESRSGNADNQHEQTKKKLDTDNMTPAQIEEYEKRIDEETRAWNNEPRYDSEGNRLI